MISVWNLLWILPLTVIFTILIFSCIIISSIEQDEENKDGIDTRRDNGY